jgi:glycosyltransferase involved in cell wall biosynthesis
MTDRAPSRSAPVVHVIADGSPTPYFRMLIESGSLGHEAFIVGSVGPPGPLQEDLRSIGVSTFALNAASRRQFPLATVRLSRLLRNVNASVVQTHLLDASLVGLAAGRLARTPVRIHTAHHSHELPFHGLRLILPETLCVRLLADHVIAPSEEVAATLQQYTHVSPSKIAVVHHGLDFRKFDPTAVDRDAIRAELGLTANLVFGAVGRLYRLKNYEALLQAFKAATAGIPEAFLAIFGGGDKAALQRQVADLGLSEHVGIYAPRDDIPAVMSSFDVFVHPALAESFGMVIIEAMAMERPVLTTPVGIAPVIIEPGRTGVLCAGTDTQALTAGLRTILELRPQWDQLGRAARIRVEGMTAERMADDYLALYAKWLPAD